MAALAVPSVPPPPARGSAAGTTAARRSRASSRRGAAAATACARYGSTSTKYTPYPVSFGGRCRSSCSCGTPRACISTTSGRSWGRALRPAWATEPARSATIPSLQPRRLGDNHGRGAYTPRAPRLRAGYSSAGATMATASLATRSTSHRARSALEPSLPPFGVRTPLLLTRAHAPLLSARLHARRRQDSIGTVISIGMGHHYSCAGLR